MILPFRFPVIAGVLFLCGVVGCAKPKEVETLKAVPASGEVLLNGKPLVDATVSFISADGKISCRAVTDDQGKFVLSTYDPNDGAPPGKYQVLISIDEFDVSPEGRPVPKAKKRSGPPVAARYSRQSESPLSAEVTEAGPNKFRFQLN
jgi:hypothetical protein